MRTYAATRKNDWPQPFVHHAPTSVDGSEGRDVFISGGSGSSGSSGAGDLLANVEAAVAT